MWAEQETNEVLYALNTTEDGLTDEEVKKRQEEYGKNVLPKAKRASVLKLIFNQFKSAIMLILFIAIGLSLAIGEYSNVIFIGAVIVINVILGFIQEFTAQRSSEKLQEQLNIKIEVIRNKEIVLLNSEDLVVGDIVLLESGNKIPADIRLIETTNFKVDESILSGESEGREKNCEKGKACSNIIDCTNMVYAGTAVLSGRAKGVVVETGINTEFGKISNKVINMKEAPSPLVIRINKFVKQISLFFAVLVLFLSIVLYVKGYHITDIMFSVIALTVSAIPEGLSTAVTISLSLSSNRMAKKNVIVKNLNSVESLGSCTVIASDKTGTLTVNEQTAKMIVLPDNSKLRVTGEGYSVVGSVEVSHKNVNQQNQVNLIATLGFLNNEAQVKYQQEQYSFIGDSIDIAFKVLGIKNGVQTDDIKVASKIPYESENRYSALEYLQNDKRFVTIKGSPETVIEHCQFMQKDGETQPIDKKLILSQNEKLASDGYRVIAIAYGEQKKALTDNINGIEDLTMLGLVAFIDPAREETYDAVKSCQESGVKVYMITGDHPLTAYSIGKDLNIVKDKSQVTTGEQIDEMMKRGQAAFDLFIKSVRICARVTPLQKLAIVESLKRQGEFVAVTGDGINDTLAIKQANIGIAVGSGSDIAKEASDMIITDDKFSSIVSGINEGRMAYGNIRNVIYLLLSTGFCEIILYCLSIIFGLQFPLTAIQFLWLNLITNGIQSNAFAFEKPIDHISNKRIKKTNENIFNKLLISEILISGIFIGISVFVVYFILSKTSMNLASTRAIIVTLMVFFEDIQVINCRNEYLSLFKVPLKNNWILVSTIILSIVLQCVFVMVAPIRDFLNMGEISNYLLPILLAASLSIIVVMELFKVVINKKLKQKINNTV